MANDANRGRILCISFSDITSDSRVLRQLDVLAELGEVTTVGYGAKPRVATEHIAIDENLASLPQTPLGVALLALRRFDTVEFMAPAVRAARELLKGRRFDVVIANEARAMAIAHEVAQGAPVVADMHEWAPEERSHVRSWRLLVKPFMTHQCAKYLSKMTAVTTVNGSIAELYQQRFGVRPDIVRNAAAYRDFVQARIAVVFGTAPETDRLIKEHDLGVIARDASAEAMRETLAALDADQVREFKQNVHKAAKVLNSAEDAATLRTIVGDLLARTR